MLHHMARGESGRIVLEIDPSEKDELYTALKKDGLTLKEWFLARAKGYVRERAQLPLFGALGEETIPYKTRKQNAKESKKKR